MDKHAIAILGVAESWSWPITLPKQKSGTISPGGKYKSVTAKLLSGFIADSVSWGGTLLDQFWSVVGDCDSRLNRNSESWLFRMNFLKSTFTVENLKHTEFSSPDESVNLLFEGLNRETIDFQPVFHFATELMTYLGVACTDLSFTFSTL